MTESKLIDERLLTGGNTLSMIGLNKRIRNNILNITGLTSYGVVKNFIADILAEIFQSNRIGSFVYTYPFGKADHWKPVH